MIAPSGGAGSPAVSDSGSRVTESNRSLALQDREWLAVVIFLAVSVHEHRFAQHLAHQEHRRLNIRSLAGEMA